MICRIIKVLPLECREYNDKSGNKAVWKSKGFILSDGFSSYYAVAQQSQAEAIETLALKGNEVANIKLRVRAREYQVNNVVHYSNELEIVSFLIIARS